MASRSTASSTRTYGDTRSRPTAWSGCFTSGLLLARAQFRRAKFPVLAAIRAGDVKAAVVAFDKLLALTEEMVATARCAPNTVVLTTHWSKLALWPQRLKAIQLHLPELCQERRFRSVWALSTGAPMLGLTVGQQAP